MISVGENKALLCKGDFHPAELYKGDKKIAGFTRTEFSGESGVTLENCYNDKLYNTQIIGNSVQDGTPTPETPIEVKSVGDLTTKNLLNIDSGLNECLIKNEDGTYTLRKASGTRFSATMSIYIPANTNFAFGFDVVENNRPNVSWQAHVLKAELTHSDGTFSYLNIYYNLSGSSTSSYHVTSNSKDIVGVRLCMLSDEGVGDYITFKNLQIEEGSTATEYEPYHKYKVPVRARGKNLFDCLNSQKYENNFGHDNALIADRTENTITIQKTMNNDYEFAMFALPDGLEGKTITVYAEWTCSGENAGGIRVNWDTTLESSNIIAFSRKSGVAVSGVVSGKPENATHLALLLYGGTTTNHKIGDEVYYKNIMVTIDEPSTATPYEPYIEPQTFNIYLDEPLRKVGDYADYIDFEKGVVMRNIAKKIFDGTEYWTFDISTNNNTLFYQKEVESYITGLSSKITALCNRLRGRTWSVIWKNYYKSSGATDLITGVAVVYNSNDGSGRKYLYFRVSPYSSLPTLDEWKAQLAAWYEAGTPFTVWYVIPDTEESIELPELPTFKGTTIYEIDTSITATISGKYKKVI